MVRIQIDDNSESYEEIRSASKLTSTEADPTSLCTYEEYTENAEALYEVIKLRAESVNAQLDGTVPATKAGQAENPEENDNKTN